MAGVPDDHVPPVVALVNVITEPAHTVVGPVIVPADGGLDTVIVVIAVPAPQDPVTV